MSKSNSSRRQTGSPWHLPYFAIYLFADPFSLSLSQFFQLSLSIPLDHTRDERCLRCTNVIVENELLSSSPSTDRQTRRTYALIRLDEANEYAGPSIRARETPTCTRRARGNDWSPIERRRSSTWPRLPPPLGARAASRPADARTTPPAHPILHRYRRTTVSYLWLFATTPTFPFPPFHCLSVFSTLSLPLRGRANVIDAVFKNPVLFLGEKGGGNARDFFGEFFLNMRILFNYRSCSSREDIKRGKDILL